jgi:hypothetical protein
MVGRDEGKRRLWQGAYRGRTRRRGLGLIAATLIVAIPIWAQVVPWPTAVVVLPAWIWDQVVVRRESGWGWSPLLPSWGELLGGDGGPRPFARARDLGADDPRRGWEGRE